MKVLNEEAQGGITGKTHVIILEKKEAQELIAMATAAAEANKRKSSWRKLQQELEERLNCF